MEEKVETDRDTEREVRDVEKEWQTLTEGLFGNYSILNQNLFSQHLN